MPKVLVIDDDAAVRHVIARILSQRALDVLQASDGRQGLAVLQAEQPDLIITDIIMPEMEGIETIREIRRIVPDIKIIAISGGGRVGNFDFLTCARKLGASEVLAKPFDPAALLDLVERCLCLVKDSPHDEPSS